MRVLWRGRHKAWVDASKVAAVDDHGAVLDSLEIEIQHLMDERPVKKSKQVARHARQVAARPHGGRLRDRGWGLWSRCECRPPVEPIARKSRVSIATRPVEERETADDVGGVAATEARRKGAIAPIVT